jgi:hypothetical protein
VKVDTGDSHQLRTETYWEGRRGLLSKPRTLPGSWYSPLGRLRRDELPPRQDPPLSLQHRQRPRQQYGENLKPSLLSKPPPQGKTPRRNLAPTSNYDAAMGPNLILIRELHCVGRVRLPTLKLNAPSGLSCSKWPDVLAPSPEPNQQEERSIVTPLEIATEANPETQILREI